LKIIENRYEKEIMEEGYFTTDTEYLKVYKEETKAK